MSNEPERITEVLHTDIERPCAHLRWEDDNGPHEMTVETSAVAGSLPGPGGADIVILAAGKGVSRRHTEFYMSGGGLWVRDLDSRNGTFINDVRVREGHVPARGGQVKLGSAMIDVSYDVAPKRVKLWPSEQFHGMVGGSEKMREIFSRVDRFAKTDQPVLIMGETGTGKELVASAVHKASSRSAGSFGTFDCTVLNENVVESELFGHEKGAFTGAIQARKGLVRTCKGGTMFLDEIGELSPTIQARLLRLLENKEFKPVGLDVALKADVRIVAATNKNLRQMVANNKFREDLYQRLSTFDVTLPPLRERREDIPLLLRQEAFLGAQVPLSKKQMDRLERLPWYGNVRALKKFAEWVKAFDVETALRIIEEHQQQEQGSDHHSIIDISKDWKTVKEKWTCIAERAYWKQMLSACRNNKLAAARRANVDPGTLHNIVNKHEDLFGHSTAESDGRTRKKGRVALPEEAKVDPGEEL